jgi:NTP pyrophosphatase (non-canonical NTP hydrolase)
MNLKKYQELCKQTSIDHDSKEKEIMTLGLGISGEAGDVAGCIKKTFSHGDNQKTGIRENLGDTLWYIAMICNYFGWDLEDVLEENIKKLRERHPEGFSFENARKTKRRDWNEVVVEKGEQ